MLNKKVFGMFLLVGFMILACKSNKESSSTQSVRGEGVAESNGSKKDLAIKEFISSSTAMREGMNKHFIENNVPLAEQIKAFDQMDKRIYEGLTRLRSMSEEEFNSFLKEAEISADCSGVVTFFAFTKTLFKSVAAPASEFDGMNPVAVAALKVGAVVFGSWLIAVDVLALPVNIWNNAVSIAEEGEICDQQKMLSL